MRVTIKFDSATTRQVRDLSVALNRVLGDNGLTLGVEGPECWHGETPKLNPNQFADVVGWLVKFNGEPIGEAAKRAATTDRFVCKNTWPNPPVDATVGERLVIERARRALGQLENLTSDDFANGRDRPVREALASILWIMGDNDFIDDDTEYSEAIDQANRDLHGFDTVTS